jgi:preprotein translocase subunit YajC
MLFALLVLLADAQPKEPAPPEVPGWASLVPIILIFGVFYFLIILPTQRRERKQREALFAALKKNDEVVTAGGIIGVVQSIKDDEVVIKIDDNAKMRVVKSSIARIIPKETPAAAPPAAT